MISSIKNILSKILFCLLLLITMILIAKMVAKKFFNNYFFLGFDISYIASGSMEPTLKINDYVLCIKTNDVKKGDIIVYVNESKHRVIHRVVEVNENEIITKGDNNDANDEPIKKKNVEGKYIKTIIHSNALTKLLSNQIFRYATILILGIIIILILTK